jgi:phospholipid/cholesterol/gamma-HCH transport system substrate-binding protein
MKKDRLREISMEAMVGAFMFSVLMVLGALTIILSRDNLLKESYAVTVVFDEVRGLLPGDLVTTRGVRIGRIRDLVIRHDGVHVNLKLDEDVSFYKDYRIEIVPSSILGGQYVALNSGSRAKGLLPAGEQLRGQPPVDIMAEAAETIQVVRSALEGGMLDDLRSAMRRIDSIAAKIDSGQGTIGRLLVDETLYADLEATVSNLQQVSARLSEGKGTIGKLLSEDDSVYDTLLEIAGDLKVVSDRLANGQGTLGRLLAEDDQLYEDLAASAVALRGVSESINNGEGTLGRLAKDEELYVEAKLLLHEVRAMVDDIRETSPITTFSSVFFGAF